MDSEHPVPPLNFEQMQANGNNGFSTDKSQPSGRPLRIALLISELEVGGAEQNLVRLALGLQQRGHWVTVYSLDPAPPTSQAALVQKLQAADVPLRFLAHTPNRIANRRTRQTLRQAQSADRVDLVYSFLFRANLANVWANRWSLLDRPLATTAQWLRQCWPKTRHPGLAVATETTRASRTPSPSPATIIGLRQADPRPIVRRLEATLLRFAHATVCVSAQVAQHYAPALPLVAPAAVARGRSHQVLVIPNGIETAANTHPETRPTSPPADLLACLTAAQLPVPVPADPSSVRLDTPSTAPPQNARITPPSGPPTTRPATAGPLPILLYVGRLTHQKGLDLLLAAAPSLLAKLPHHHLVLVGQGDQRQALEEQAQSLACGDRIHFLGWRPNPQDYLAAAQIVLLHSRWEGQPNVILEAMNLGKPVVTTWTAGIQELFHDSEPSESDTTRPLDPTSPPDTGQQQPAVTTAAARAAQVVSAGDSAALVAAVLHLAQNPDTAENIGRWNQSRIRNHFNLPQFINAHEQLFRVLAPQ